MMDNELYGFFHSFFEFWTIAWSGGIEKDETEFKPITFDAFFLCYANFILLVVYSFYGFDFGNISVLHRAEISSLFKSVETNYYLNTFEK